MSTALNTIVPVLDGTNYQVWMRAMKAFLRSQDLWFYVNGTWTRPGFADPANPTDAEIAARNLWDSNSNKAMGFITLHLTPIIQDKVESINTAALVWTRLETDYSAISPTQVFDLYKKTLTFRIDQKKPPCPQFEYLEGLYTHLAAETVDIPGFIHAMTLLAAHPPSWEAPIIQSVLSSGQLAQVTMDLAKTTVQCYWDAERAKRSGAHVANKISTVKRKSNNPSFQKQKKKASDGDSNAPSSGKKGNHKRRGKRAGQKTHQSQGYGHVHFANSALLPAPSSHSIGDYNPQGLMQRVVHDTPVTSSFGNGPWDSFNKAMNQADAMKVHKGPQTVKTLEQRIMMKSSSPVAGVKECGPVPSSSKAQIIHVSDTYGEESDNESDDNASNASIASAPPFLGKSTIFTRSSSKETAVSLGSATCISSHPPSNNCDDCSMEEAHACMICDRASGWDDLFAGDDGYVPSILALQCASHASSLAWEWTSINIKSVEKLLCTCPMAACMKCKGISVHPSTINPFGCLILVPLDTLHCIKATLLTMNCYIHQ
jgi:hypothetical protein